MIIRINHSPDAGQIAQHLDLQSSALLLCYGCPLIGSRQNVKIQAMNLMMTFEFQFWFQFLIIDTPQPFLVTLFLLFAAKLSPSFHHDALSALCLNIELSVYPNQPIRAQETGSRY